MATSITEDKMAIQELKHAYCEAVDEPNPAKVVSLFADDPQFSVPSYENGSGNADLEEFAQRLTSLEHTYRSHNIFNPILSISDETAFGRWYYITMYKKTDGSIEIGHGRFEDEFRKRDGVWKIQTFTANREITLEF